MIHPSSIISNKASINKNVTIGPYCIIGDNVEIEEGCDLISHIQISGNTYIGKNNTFYPFSSIGLPPQDMKYEGENSKLIIGNNNSIISNNNSLGCEMGDCSCCIVV